MNILQMLPAAQPVKTLAALHGSQRFITTFTNSHHLAFPIVTRSEPSPSHHISCRYISILQLAHPCLKFTSGLSPRNSQLYIHTHTHTHIYFFLFILWVATCPVHISLLDLVILVTFHEQQKWSRFSQCHSPPPSGNSLTSSLLDPKYYPQHLPLTHHKFMRIGAEDSQPYEIKVQLPIWKSTRHLRRCNSINIAVWTSNITPKLQFPYMSSSYYIGDQ